MADAPRDANHIPALLLESSTSAGTVLTAKGDQATGRLLVDSAAGSGTVTSVSVTSANGFAGTVATATTTPAITISTTINSPVLAGNGTAIAAATTTGSGSTVVLNNGPTLIAPILGTPASGTLTNTTGFPVANLAGAGTGVLTALAINTGSAGSIVLFNGALGTPSSGTLTNATGLPIVGGTTGTLSVARGGTGVITIAALSIWVANSADTITSVTPGAGQSVRINGAGNAWEAFTPSAGVPTTITVADEATDATCFVAFFTAATGDLGPKTNANLTFNSNTGVFTSASAVLTTADINGGTIDNAVIGGTTAAAITGTTITANTGFLPDADGGAYLGQPTQAFANLYLDTTATINFDNGNAVITHSSAVLTVSTGDLRVTTAGTNAASVVTIDGTQTLGNKTLTAPKFANAGFIADANGNELIIFTTTASAVNEWTLANGSTGVNPKLTASGESNVGLDFQAKGSGTYRLLGTSTQAAQLRLYEDTDDGSNFTAFKVGTQAGDITYTLPTAVGAAGSYLYDSAGNGTLSWNVPAGGGGNWIWKSTTTATNADSISIGSLDLDTDEVYAIVISATDINNGAGAELDLTFNAAADGNYGYAYNGYARDNGSAAAVTGSGNATNFIQMFQRYGRFWATVWIREITEGGNQFKVCHWEMMVSVPATSGAARDTGIINGSGSWSSTNNLTSVEFTIGGVAATAEWEARTYKVTD